MSRNEKKLIDLYLQKGEDFEYVNWKLMVTWQASIGQLRRMDDQELDSVHPEAKARMLIAAIVHHDGTEKQRLIASGVHPKPKAFHEGTALHAAAYQNDVEMLEYLLSIGADLNDRDSAGRTPLHIAAYQGSFDFLKHLVKLERLDCTVEDARGRTPLEHSIVGGHFGVMNLLACLSKHQKKLLKGSKSIRWSALHDAAIAGRTDEARFLLGIGMNPDTTDRVMGKTPLHFAIKEGRYDAVMALLSHNADPSIRDKKGRHGMHELARSSARMNDFCDDDECRIRLNFRGILHALKDFDVPMTDADDDGNTPLHLSVMEFGYPEAVQEFILPETVNARNKKGCTPLHFAAAMVVTGRDFQQQIIDMLLNAGADASAVADNDGNTPLHFSVMEYGNPDVIQKFILPETVNAKNKEGYTPLHLAAAMVVTGRDVQQRIIDMLLDAGADARVETLNGETPLSYGNPYLVESLSRREAERLITKARTPVLTRRSTL